jgi:class 3 adenylate cyclase
LETPETRYVAVGEAEVAYQTVGDGPFDLLHWYGFGDVDLNWDYLPWVEGYGRLASFCRLILFDRRGVGLSGPVPHDAMPTWEEWTEDVRAVLDAVGSERAAIFAEDVAGPIAVLFAAMQPERVNALILANTTASMMKTHDYPIGLSAEEAEFLLPMIAQMWGRPEGIRVSFPSRANDREFVYWLARVLRGAATPREAVMQYRYIWKSLDVRPVLPSIQVPTLVLHHIRNAILPIEHGRYLAEHIPGAKLVELEGDDSSLIAGAQAMWIDELGEFLTGQRPTVEFDRILTTMLFTDIVGSTELAASLGDQAWRSLLDAHDRTVRHNLRRYRGNEIKTTGDGFLASFDGPARAIRCALAMAEATRALGIELHVGLHTGECEVRGDDLFGLAVHIAARIGSLATPGEVLVSGTVKDLVAGSGIDFEDRGEHELKGVPGSWKIYAVTD